jgi:hypothetical protein
MRVIGIDAALRHSGIAILRDGNLERYETIRIARGGLPVLAEATWEMHGDILGAHVVIEWPPQSYRGRAPQVRLLAAASGIWAGACAGAASVRFVEPKGWGTICGSASAAYPWAISICRAKGWALPSDEHQADALAIALWGYHHAGR